MTDQENLIHDGVCPVCGEEFTDGFENIGEAESIEGVRLCIIKKDGSKEIGECLLHLPDDQEGYDLDEDPQGLTEPEVKPYG